MIDKQVREAIGEHVVMCRRLDGMGIPLIGWVLNLIGLKIRMPQVHIAAVRCCAGMSLNAAPTVDRWGVYTQAATFGAATTPLSASKLKTMVQRRYKRRMITAG